jgi:hypothetical protein
VVLGLAAPSALADPRQCQARCAADASPEMESCVHRCPEARDPTKASSFQTCALRCKAKFDSTINACKQHCPGSQEGKGKKQSSP